MQKSNRSLWGALVVGAVLLSGCASRGSQVIETTTVLPAPQVPGTVESIWEEPMVNVIEVPPGLDPEGIYYRPGHQAVVEIKQGRWRYERER